MSHFYGYLKGNRGETHRCGSKGSGMWAEVKSWDSELSVTLHEDGDGKDVYDISVSPIRGAGQEKLRLRVNGEEFIYYKGKVYKGEHEVLGEKL